MVPTSRDGVIFFLNRVKYHMNVDINIIDNIKTIILIMGVNNTTILFYGVQI